MALVKWEPFKDLIELHEKMNRLFEETLARTRGEAEIWEGAWYPPVDIYETDNEIVLKAELPGIDIKDIDITVEDGVLTLKGERKFEEEVKRENYHRIERSYGRFVRSFSLPNTVDVDKIKARMENGILKVIMPKKEESKPKQIKVEIK